MRNACGAGGRFESLWVDVTEAPYENGARGKRIIINLVEREGDAAVPSGPPTVPAEYATPPAAHTRVYPPDPSAA